MKVIALLPMKAHSSRVPGKNFRKIAGKPLFRWILDELLKSEFVDEVIINTDARGIIVEAGLPQSDKPINIRDRAPELCGDDVSMNRIIEDDLSHSDADAYIMTHTTNPAITSQTVDAAFHTYREGLTTGNDSLFGVNRFQTRFYRADGTPVNHDPDNLIPTQDLEPWFEENSCLYLFSKNSFAATHARIGRTPVLFETPPLESCDIDEPHDWELAEIILKAKANP